MYKFGKQSQARLETCDERLQQICNELIKRYDVKIIEGHREEEKQNDVFDKGLSKLQWPDSKHNKLPSLAVDIAPYPVHWEIKYRDRFYFMAGAVYIMASLLEVSIRWGGDWDRDLDFHDQSFMDLPHFELIEI